MEILLHWRNSLLKAKQPNFSSTDIVLYLSNPN